MKLPKILIGLVSGLMLSACASSPFMPHTVSVPKPPPPECTLKCPAPPPKTLPRMLWEAEIAAWGFDCKDLHDDCVDAMSR
ncbi:hypothetical protein [Thauera aromatica]|uniref:hypothetical protein n=1 Tax=Thauera aromatica TaxID=59405 RepID=UPI001FFCFD40|nr:hypothetical protein [Thauera aromatica]MCK2097657.1 hypothetical protein [Thauera aromatica]